MTGRHWALGAGILLLALTGCSGGTMSTPPDGPSEPPSQGTPSEPSMSPSSPPGVPAARWAAIEKDLASRGVDATPTLVSAEAVTWRNGALGCPQPGMQYTQALVDGMQVIVEAGGRQYDYRFGTGDRPLLCQGGRPGVSTRP